MIMKNVMATIGNYNPAFKYTLYLRVKGNNDPFGFNPLFTKVATGASVLFSNVPDNEYEVGIKQTCNNYTSDIVWADVYDKSCESPKVYIDGTDIKIQLPSATCGYEWKIDENNWLSVSSDNTSLRTLAIADMQDEYDEYGSDRPNSILDIQFRTVCGSDKKSGVTHLFYIETRLDVPKITLIKNICEDGYFKGQILRLTLGKPQTVECGVFYDDLSVPTTVLLASIAPTGTIEDDITYYREALSGFNLNYEVNGPLSERGAFFDFITKQPPQNIILPALPICGDYPVNHYGDTV